MPDWKEAPSAQRETLIQNGQVDYIVGTGRGDGTRQTLTSAGVVGSLHRPTGERRRFGDRVNPMPGSILGTQVRRIEDEELLLGQGTFVDNDSSPTLLDFGGQTGSNFVSRTPQARYTYPLGNGWSAAFSAENPNPQNPFLRPRPQAPHPNTNPTNPLNLVTGLFNNILFPNLKRLQSRNGDIEQEYYFVLNVISFITFPLVLLFVVFPREMVLLLWGKNWAHVADLLPYFGLLIFTQSLLSTAGHLLILYKKERAFMISGWITALFLISFIILGATISLEAIAQFYSLSYIVFIILLNVYYIYIKSLGLNRGKVYAFWLPKVILSLLLWLCLYFHLDYLRNVMMAVFSAYVLFSGRPLLKAVAGRLGQTAPGARFLQSIATLRPSKR